MINEILGNYYSVVGFKVYMIVLFLVAVVDLLVRAKFRMKRKRTPFATPKFWVVVLVVVCTIILHIRNANFEIVHINFGIIDLFLAYLLDLIVLTVVVIAYARLLTVISFIIVSLAFELAPAVNRMKVLRLFFADWSLKKSILRA